MLCMLAFGFAQLAIAGHQFQHDAGPATDVCAVCLQLDHLDVPHATEPAEVPVTRTASPTGRKYDALVSVARFHHFDSRAPPSN